MVFSTQSPSDAYFQATTVHPEERIGTNSSLVVVWVLLGRISDPPLGFFFDKQFECETSSDGAGDRSVQIRMSPAHTDSTLDSTLSCMVSERRLKLVLEIAPSSDNSSLASRIHFA